MPLSCGAGLQSCGRRPRRPVWFLEDPRTAENPLRAAGNGRVWRPAAGVDACPTWAMDEEDLSYVPSDQLDR